MEKIKLVTRKCLFCKTPLIQKTGDKDPICPACGIIHFGISLYEDAN